MMVCSLTLSLPVGSFVSINIHLSRTLKRRHVIVVSWHNLSFLFHSPNISNKQTHHATQESPHRFWHSTSPHCFSHLGRSGDTCQSCHLVKETRQSSASSYRIPSKP